MKSGGNVLNDLKEYFSVVVSDDRMSAEIHCEKLPNDKNIAFDEQSIIRLLKDSQVTYGVNQKVVALFTNKKLSIEDFPIIIAKGVPPKNGNDGIINYEFNLSSEIIRGTDWNFRDIMRIPSVKTNQKLATITHPTKGVDGIDVFGNTLKAQAGKPVQTKAGMNVSFNEQELSFYSTIEGQVSITEHHIKVHPVYEVNETLSMKTGNLDFVGSIVIKGDVPTGYTVKAKGDVKIFGLVEAATVIAGGSIYISEGLAGLQKGMIKAGENIHIGYINQGIAQTEDSIYVENSIVHSEVTANHQILCQKGNIIGGSLSAGQLIEAKDVGNRLSTKTHISLGINKQVAEEQTRLEKSKQELTSTLKKLTTIGEKLKNKKHDPKTRITLLRQRNSQLQMIEKIKAIDEQLSQMSAILGSEKEANVVIKNNVFPNVIISFGKYKHKIDRMHNHIRITLDQNEIVMHALESNSSLS